jgi:hypothetical protein
MCAMIPMFRVRSSGMRLLVLEGRPAAWVTVI